MKNILITSAGRRVSLVKFFKTELKKVFADSKVFTTDLRPEYAAACQVSDGFFKICKVSDDNYISELLKIALSNDIQLIIPTIDTELLILSQNISLFNDNKIEIVISDFDLIKIFRDKRKTHNFFQKININYAKEFDKNNFELPIFIKPIDGSRSVDNFVIHKKEDLTAYHLENPKLMFLEYLNQKTHTEYTIDLYYDKKSQLKCLVPRQRIEVRDGEVNKAVTRMSAFYDEIWQKMQNIKGFRGCITLQIFENNQTNQIFGIEINPRFGGGFPLSYLAGANFVKWIIDEFFLNKEIEICDNWQKNLMMLRYDDEILIPNFEI